MALPSDSATSSGVSPPSQGKSSLVQESGLMPILTSKVALRAGDSMACAGLFPWKGRDVLNDIFLRGIGLTIFAAACLLHTPCAPCARSRGRRLPAQRLPTTSRLLSRPVGI